jgi:hypothetical protein
VRRRITRRRPASVFPTAVGGREKREEHTVKKALTTIVAAAGLVVVVQAADARSLPTTYVHAKAAHAKVKRAGAPPWISGSSVVICPELAPGDNGGYCLVVPSDAR